MKPIKSDKLEGFDPAEQRDTTERDENGGKVSVTDSGALVDVIDDRKATIRRPDGSIEQV